MGGTVQQAGIGPAEGVEGPFVQGLTDPGHQLVIEVQIVEHSQAHSQHLPRSQQVPEVGTGEAPAGGTLTGLVDGTGIQLELLIFDVDGPLPGILIGLLQHRITIIE